jgi:hypothetical protein
VLIFGVGDCFDVYSLLCKLYKRPFFYYSEELFAENLYVALSFQTSQRRANMGKYKGSLVNPDKRKAKQRKMAMAMGPCGKEKGKTPCLRRMRNPETNGLCHSSCDVPSRGNNKKKKRR